MKGYGNTLNNVIVGNSSYNTINGGAGADMMIGGDGNDNYSSTTSAIQSSRAPARATIPSRVDRRLQADRQCRESDPAPAAPTSTAPATRWSTSSTATAATICSTAAPVPTR